MTDQPRTPDLGADLPEHLRPPAADSTAGRIHAAARSRFASGGFAGTSTRNIAEAAGVNLAMIHYHFGSKEQLYCRVIELEVVHLQRIMQRELGTDPSPREVATKVPVFALRLHQERPELIQLILREMADGAPRLSRILADLGDHGPLGLRRLLLGAVESAYQDGSFATDVPPAHLVAILFSIGNGLQAFAPLIAEVFGVDLADPATVDAVADSAQRIVSRALAPGKESRP